MSSIAKMFLGAAGAFVVAVVSWLAGLEAGGFLVLRSADDLCHGRVSRLSEHLIPLSNRCTFADGTTRDLVPAWVNPAVGAGLAGGVVLGLLAMRAANRP